MGVGVLAAWSAGPLHAVAGILGVVLLVWSLLPLSDAPTERVRRGIDPAFWVQAVRVWQTHRARGLAATAAIALIAWSVSATLLGTGPRAH